MGIRHGLAAQLSYACCYWVEHLTQVEKSSLTKIALADGGAVDHFLRELLLQWLEALSLIEKLPDAIKLLKTLRALVDVSATTFKIIRVPS